MTDPDPQSATGPRSIFIIYMQLRTECSICECIEDWEKDVALSGDVNVDVDADCGLIHLIVHLIKLIMTGTQQQVNLSTANSVVNN